MLLRSMPVEEVVAAAGRILVGTVVEVRSDRDAGGTPATWVTLAVSRTVRGPHDPRVTFKQFGVELPLPDGTLIHLPGSPRYRAGDEVVLFLREESDRGFTSPVGLGQGLYRIDRTHGRRVVTREFPGGAPEDLDAFLATVQRLSSSSREGSP